ncbi:DUF6156 family protein [Sorangium sp. So ce1024]|uniref:DUF6156 family protein n=1 Tax=unclassified Sorangium TaxID=2621164 RepID=UPI003F04E0FB
MANDRDETIRYFLTYRGMGLPLSLGEELDAASVENRGTYFRARYDAHSRMVRCEKLVYGEVELEHVYEYDTEGRLTRAVLTTAGDEPRVLTFDPAVAPAR